MIFTIIIQMILNLLTWIFGWFKIPSLPQPLQEALNYITQFFTTPIVFQKTPSISSQQVYKPFLENKVLERLLRLSILQRGCVGRTRAL